MFNQKSFVDRYYPVADSCEVGLYNGNLILIKLETTNFTPTTSFTDPRDVRYNHKLAPAIWKDKWRKGSQVMRKLYLCPFIPFSGVLLDLTSLLEEGRCIYLQHLG
jgi:hypothetical protein